MGEDGIVRFDFRRRPMPLQNRSCMKYASTHQGYTFAVALACATVILAALSGCETEASYAQKQAAEWAAIRPDQVMVIRHHVGGTHHRAIVRGDICYATFSNDLLVISTAKGSVIGSVQIMPFGTCGGAVEMVAPESGGALYVLLDGTAVVELSIADPKTPVITATRTAAEIGFAPRSISLANGELWIAGDGGVVAWSEVGAFALAAPAASPSKVLAGKSVAPFNIEAPPAFLAAVARERGAIGSVVATNDGLAAVSGRRVLKLDDGSFIGAATRIDPLPSDVALRLQLPGGFTFILQGAEGAQVGLMGPDVREVAARAVRGTVRRVRVIGDTLFAINDEEMTMFPIEAGPNGPRLGEPVYAPVKGALDVDAVSSNDFVVVGSFGRARWRKNADSRGGADEFYGARREPSNLRVASTDRRRILASGPEGTWLYIVGDEVSLISRPPQLPGEASDGRRMKVSSSWGKAAISDDYQTVSIVPGNRPSSAPAATGGKSNDASIEWRPILGGEIFGVEALDGRLWIWHANGVDVMTVDAGSLRPEASVRIEGPVRYLFPQRVGGAAAYVSERGGFGLLDFVERAALSTTPGERVVDRDGDGVTDVELSPAEKAGASRGFETKPTEIRREDVTPSP